MFQSPSDIAFVIFNFPIYYYGIILSFSISIGVLSAYYLYKIFYVKKASYIIEISSYIILLGIIGARLYYCFVNYAYYIHQPLEILNIRQGGLSIHGMIIAGVLSLYFFAKKYKMSFLKLTDVFLCATSLAQSIGRWGNFFNSEAFGTPTNLPWKLYIAPLYRPIEYIDYEYFHPTFLYESILDFLIFIILLSLFKKMSKTPGKITCLYLILYSLVRIFVEHFRVDSVLYIGGIPIAQLVSILLILFALILFLFIKKNNPN